MNWKLWRRTPLVPVSTPIETSRGTVEVVAFEGIEGGIDHFVAVFPGRERSEAAASPLVRVHSSCATGDLLGSTRCDCGPQLEEALDLLAAQGGVLVYLLQEGRGIGLLNKIKTYILQRRGQDTYAANRTLGLPEDARDYGVAAEMLKALGMTSIRLLSNNPEKARALEAAGIEVVSVPTTTFLTPQNARYLLAKATLTGHSLNVVPVSLDTDLRSSG
jgi:GTP cyclohydrolase II